jgi:hypothetical protein
MLDPAVKPRDDNELRGDDSEVARDDRGLCGDDEFTLGPAVEPRDDIAGGMTRIWRRLNIRLLMLMARPRRD